MNRNRLVNATLLLLALGIPAAAQEPAKKKPAQTTLARVNSAPPVRPAAATDDPEYVIGPTDVLDVHVWKEPDFTRVVPVRPDGKISLPLLDDIQAAGLTPKQLGLRITESLKKYVTGPQVTIIVAAINSQRIYLVGEVARPGAFPMLPKMTVLQALASAGGLSQYANPKKAYVLRYQSGKAVKFPFNYKALIAGAATNQNIQLQPGDTIVVP